VHDEVTPTIHSEKKTRSTGAELAGVHSTRSNNVSVLDSRLRYLAASFQHALQQISYTTANLFNPQHF